MLEARARVHANNQIEAIRRIASIALSTALALVGFTALLYISAYSVLLLRLPFRPLPLIATFILLAGLVVVLLRKRLKANRSQVWSSVILGGLGLLVSFFVVFLVYDTSFDGQGYHMLAILRISEGWNPLYQHWFGESLWVMHYAKGPWIIGAAIYTLTGYIEAGKSIGVVYMLAALCTSLAALLKLWVFCTEKFGRRERTSSVVTVVLPALAIALCAAFNPVVVMQLFSTYNDGLVGSMVLILIGSFLYSLLSDGRKGVIVAAATMLMLLNVKFTAIAYAGLLCAWYIVALVLRHGLQLRRESGGKLWPALRSSLIAVPVRRGLLVLLTSSIVGLLVLGWNPYIINTKNQGHPFFPLAGEGAVDIMTLNSPDNFIEMNRFKSLIVSLISKTGDPMTPASSQRAELWPIIWDDYRQMTVDTRVSGFGVLSPWILIGSVLLALLLLALRWRTGVVSMLALMLVMTTVLINPEPWWARYVPQLWIVPLVLIAAAWMSRSNLLRSAGLLLLLVCLTNAGAVVNKSVYSSVNNSKAVKAQFQQLQGSQLIVSHAGFIAITVRLEEYGIPYQLVSDDAISEEADRFLHTPARYMEQEQQ